MSSLRHLTYAQRMTAIHSEAMRDALLAGDDYHEIAVMWARWLCLEIETAMWLRAAEQARRAIH